MSPGDEQVRALRDALALSPDNVPLRILLARTLSEGGRLDDAIEEFRAVMQLAPDDLGARLGLAECYLDSGKTSHAAVLLDDVVVSDRATAPCFVLLARVRLAEGELAGANTAFRRAVELDPSLAESEIAKRLGFRADPEIDDERERVTNSGRHPDDDESVLGDADFERPRLTFADVGGMDEVKDEISMKVIQPLAHPELFAAYGKGVGGGVLLYGPPGCGKTHLARATAGEAQAAFLSVGIHDVLDMWTGASERNLHRVFTEARRRSPCVLFFDEVDALGAKRSDMSNAHGRQSINQFLSELDGVADSNDGLLVLAATNAPWHLDSAFRRPGRFDRLVFVPPPDAAARAAILRILLDGKPTKQIDFARVAKKTNRFSGADLKGLVDVTIEGKLRDALRAGVPAPIEERDLLRAAKKVRPSTAEWFATAKNHVLFANQAGAYDDVARYMGLKKT